MKITTTILNKDNKMDKKTTTIITTKRYTELPPPPKQQCIYISHLCTVHSFTTTVNCGDSEEPTVALLKYNEHIPPHRKSLNIPKLWQKNRNKYFDSFGLKRIFFFFFLFWDCGIILLTWFIYIYNIYVYLHICFFFNGKVDGCVNQTRNNRERE